MKIRQGFWFSRKLTKKYAVDISGFDRMPGSEDWINYDFWLEYDEKRNDHSPQVMFYLEIFGIVIIDFCLYNVNHAKEDWNKVI